MPIAPSPYSVIIGKSDDPSGPDPTVKFAIMLDGTGKVPMFLQSAGAPGSTRSVTAPSALPLSAWTHLAAVLNNGAMQLYVNGQLVASGPSAGPTPSTTIPFSVGGVTKDGISVCGNCSFSGALREVRVWSRALSAAELQAGAVKRLTGSETGLVSDWPLDETTGTTAHGFGPQATTLSLLGPVMWTETSFIDGGPYWEVQDLPGLVSPPIATLPSVFTNTNHLPDLLLAYATLEHDVPTPGPVYFLHNQGNRVFTPVKPVQPSMMVFPRNETVADFNGDGLEDAVVSDHGFDAPPYPGGITRIFIQQPSGEMKDETSLRFPSGPAFTHDVCSGDVNGDGSPDLFFANLGSSAATIRPVLYLNDGHGFFHAANELLPAALRDPLGPAFVSCRFVDVNHDGSLDLVLGGGGGNPPQLRDSRDWLLLNDGHGNLRDVTFQSMPPRRGGADWVTYGTAVVDVNRDGWPDLVQTEWHNDTQGTIQLLINNGDGTFHEQDDAALNVIRNDGWLDKSYPVDINKDGWTDLVANENAGNWRALLFQNVGGHFVERTASLPVVGLGRPADFDADGIVDIALVQGNETKVAWGKNLWPAVAVATPVVTGVVASGGFPGIAQNGWVEIYGTDLTPLSVPASGTNWSTAKEFLSGMMPTALGGVSVTINGKAAFIDYESPTQLNVLAPLDATLGKVDIVVTSGGRSSAPFSVSKQAVAPSFPLIGGHYVVATHVDYSLIGPASQSAPGYPFTPAKPGETIVLYAFGFSLPTTTLVNGSSAQSGPLPSLPVIQIGGLPAAVAYAGVIGPGLYQLNVVVPAGSSDGDLPVTCSYGGAAAPAGAVITVHR